MQEEQQMPEFNARHARLSFVVQKLCEYLHASLVLALIVPVICKMIAPSGEEWVLPLFLLGLLLLTPVTALFRILVEKTASLTLVLLIGLVVSIGIYLLTAIPGQAAAGVNGQGLQVLFMAESVILLAGACSIRMRESRKIRAKLENDPDWRESPGLLQEPTAVLIIWFVLIYIAGLTMQSPAICSMALWSGIAYVLILCIYRSSVCFDVYLEEHSGVTHIPVKRMRITGRVIMSAFLLLMLVFMIPALVTGGLRRYIDLRNVQILPPPEIMMGSDFFPEEGDMNMEMLQEYLEGEPQEPSILFEIIFYILGAAAMLLLVFLAVLAIRRLFAEFRDRPQDNGDISIAIEPEEEISKLERKHSRRFGKESRREQIRRQYRTMIRKYRKEKPLPFESPDEIEARAGIADLEEMKQLHALYEEVRYGEDS